MVISETWTQETDSENLICHMFIILQKSKQNWSEICILSLNSYVCCKSVDFF